MAEVAKDAATAVRTKVAVAAKETLSAAASVEAAVVAEAIAATTADAVVAEAEAARVVAEVASPVPDLTGLPGVTDVRTDGTSVSCSVEPEAIGPVLAALTAAGVRSLTSAPPTLEELFLDAYRPAEAATR